MFESKINRGKANGYAPLDGSGKVPLDKLPPIQSTINTGSFATTGSNTFFGEQTVSGSLLLAGNISGALALVDNVEIFTSQINFVPNSSGEVGSNLSTIQLVPDVNSPSADQMLIIDPTGGFPNHIHLRPGGEMDNSSTSIILGGESSNVSVVGGQNPPVQITANNYVWQFETDGTITFPDYSVQTTAFTGINSSSFATTGSNTFIGNQTISGSLTFASSSTIELTSALSILTPSAGVPNSLSNWNGQGGWNESSYINLSTTGGTGTGLTVDVAAEGAGYIGIEAITINTPGIGYTNGDVITIDNENNLPGTFTIGVEEGSGWVFDSDGILKLNNGIGEVYADPNDFSVRIGTAGENVAPKAQIILGGPDTIFKIKSGPPLREWEFEGNGDFNLTGSINGARNLATTGSNTFNGNETISGSLYVSGSIYADNLVGLVSSSTQITTLGFVSGSYETTGRGIVSGSSQLTTSFPSKTIGSWTVPTGVSIQSFTVDAGHTYSMWVNGNVPNGIINWNATITLSNTNVPAIGSQYGWYYIDGNALVLTSIPDQIIGTNGGIITSPSSYAPNTSNIFKFGITNNSGTPQTINYGYIKLS